MVNNLAFFFHYLSLIKYLTDWISEILPTSFSHDTIYKAKMSACIMTWAVSALWTYWIAKLYKFKYGLKMLKHFRKLKSTLNQDLFLNDMIYKEIDSSGGKPVMNSSQGTWK